jgi:predicted protein tyrosine phosphatase
MWIENVAMWAIEAGHHYDAGDNSMLIQIVDPDVEFPIAKLKFKTTRGYKFLDIDGNDEDPKGWAIKDSQAKSIAEDLRFAYDNSMNVVVHCHMGVCRSGAVVEAGVMIGFQDTETFRAPNILVKSKLMHHLGLI